MTTVSKTVQLGVIILALELMRQWKSPAPRIISVLARMLNVSRKAGYEAAERVRRLLSAKESLCDGIDLRRENALLEIRVQVLGYERDHIDVRFADRKHHLPEEARILCVRLLREYREQLTVEDIARAIGVPASNLRRWNKEADDRGSFPPKSDGRGKQRHATEDDEKRVVDLFRRLEGPISIVDFAARYDRERPDGARSLDPKTIQRILERHGLELPRAKARSEPFHDEVEIYFPGAQASIDATECKVRFSRGSEEETVTLKEEVALDLASGAILGKALREEEDAEGVKRVVIEARAECKNLLAVLADNGSANRSADVRRVVSDAATVGSIFSFPRHPRTNGHIEGLFGAFKRIVGTLEIDDTSRQSVARSVVALLWNVYSHFHNYSPRSRLRGMSPIEYLRSYAPQPEEIDAARQGLERRKKRSDSLRRGNPRLEDETFRKLVDRIIAKHRLEVDLDRARKALVAYDTETIESSSHALSVARERDGFDENKRTFAYFFGIVRRKQQEIDEARLRREIHHDRTRRLIEAERRHDREIAHALMKEREELCEHPERAVLAAAKFLLSGGLRLMVKTGCCKLRTALAALSRLGQNTKSRIEALGLEIRGWGQFREKIKRDMITLLETEAAAARNSSARRKMIDPRGSPMAVEC